MSRHGLADSVQRFPTDGAFLAHRIVKLGSDGFLDLAGASDANAIGVTLNGVGAAADINRGPQVALFNGTGAVEVEVAATVTFDVGDVGYQAVDGKLADTGTVVAGVVLTGGTAGELVELLPR